MARMAYLGDGCNAKGLRTEECSKHRTISLISHGASADGVRPINNKSTILDYVGKQSLSPLQSFQPLFDLTASQTDYSKCGATKSGQVTATKLRQFKRCD